MPIPDISQGYRQPTDIRLSDGPVSKQRQDAQKMRKEIDDKKLAAASGPKSIVPGSGDPEDWPCQQYCVDNGES